MNNLKDAALFWCKIKRYISLFFIAICAIFFVTGAYEIVQAKDEKSKVQARTRLIFSTGLGLVFTFWYFFLMTDIGCGISIAGNAFRLLK
jgi:hypothetical protein